MDFENQEAIYCEGDGEYRVHCKICDKLCIQRLYKNQLTSSTHTNNNRNNKTNFNKLRKINNLLFQYVSKK